MENELINAVRNNNINEVERLLYAGANIHIQGDRPLMTAVEIGSVRMAEFLLEHGANIHASDDDALLDAFDNRDIPMIRLLLENGADVSILDDDDFDDLDNVEIIDLLRQYGVNINARVVSEDNTSEESEEEKQIQRMPILQPRADASSSDSSDEEEESIVRRLRNRRRRERAGSQRESSDSDSDSNSEEEKELDPLISAINEGDEEILTLLLEDNQPIGPTVLKYACINGTVDMVRILLENDANIHALNSQDLQEISLQNNLELISLLREYGAVVPDPISPEERRRAAREQEEKNAQLRAAALEEVKNTKDSSSENPFIEQNCASTNSLMGDPLKDTDDIVVFEFENNKGDCYLKEELKMLQSGQYIRGVGEKAYKLPWSNIWISKSLKESVENMEGFGPVKLVKSQEYVGYDENNIVWVVTEN